MKKRLFLTMSRSFISLSCATFLVAASHGAMAAAPGCDNGAKLNVVIDLPGVSLPAVGGLWGILENVGDAQRVKDKLYAMLLKQTDAQMAISCFDKAVAMASRLGGIYSDVVDIGKNGVPLPDIATFRKENIYNTFASFGIRPGDGDEIIENNTLAGHLNNVVGFPLTNYLSDGVAFAGNAAKMGANAVRSMQNLSASVTGFLNDAQTVSSAAQEAFAAINTVADTVGNITSAAGQLSMSIGSPNGLVMEAAIDFSSNIDLGPVAALIGAIGQAAGYANDLLPKVNAYLDKAQELNDKLNNTVTGAVAYMDKGLSALDEANSILGSLNTSMLGLGWPDIDPSLPDLPAGCEIAKKLWDGGVDSLTGSGPVPGMPFFSYPDLLAGVIEGAGQEMMGELTSTYNKGVVLAKAAEDLTDHLSSPEKTGLAIWRKIKQIPKDSSVSVVLSNMP